MLLFHLYCTIFFINSFFHFHFLSLPFSIPSNTSFFFIQVRNATAVFIINLSLSDLLFCCFNLPLAASTFWNRAWTHGELLCRLYPLLRYGLLAVSLFTVLAITINRYVMIGHPRAYPRFVCFLVSSFVFFRCHFFQHHFLSKFANLS